MFNAVLAESATRKRKGEIGQFLTPAPLAEFMASLFQPLPKAVRLLDAGAGAGSLIAAFVARLCTKHKEVESVEATLFEIDPLILDALAITMTERRSMQPT
jgi:adenine-specific DNA-methyltransferase